MGISTLQSYRGAQVFEAIGLNKSLVERYFTGTSSRIEGVGLDVLAREARMKHDHAFRPVSEADTELAIGGNYQYRVQRRVSPVQSADGEQAAACGAAVELRDVPGIHAADRQSEPRAVHAARA